MGTNIRLKLAKKIKALRKARNITQEKLAEIAKIDYKYIQKIEGNSPPALRVDTIDRIAKALNVTPSELLDF
jgi:transcriptional regulator with XRE-family HTH domain